MVAGRLALGLEDGAEVGGGGEPFLLSFELPFAGEREGEGGGESGGVSSCPETAQYIVPLPSPRRRSLLAFLLLAASARACACISFCFSLISRSLLFLAAVVLRFCFDLDLEPSSAVAGDTLRSSELDKVRCRLIA